LSTYDRSARANATDGCPSAISESAPLVVQSPAGGSASVDAGQRSPPEPLLLSDREAAALLGISRAHFHRLRAAGKFGPEPIRLGRTLRFERDEVVRWARARCPEATTWRAMEAQRRRLRAV
jgi:excisionase family DNA binding protein